jgi:hypothetical protein
VSLKLFETNIYRTQKDFEKLTAPGTHASIRIGPDFGLKSQNARYSQSDYLGVVGLHDFTENSGEPDEVVFLQGQTVNGNNLDGNLQIRLNFNPDDQKKGLDNDNNALTYEVGASDQWLSVLNASGNMASLLAGSQVEGSDYGLFANSLEPEMESTELSPFNGVFFGSNDHGEFSGEGFRDSLYFRLDDTFGTSINQPTGKYFGHGVLAFWFRLPSFYYRPPFFTDYSSNRDGSFSQTFFALNLWEKYAVFNDGSINNMKEKERPVTLSCGLRFQSQENAGKGQWRIFSRYEASGGLPFNFNFLTLPYLSPLAYTLQLAGDLTESPQLTLLDNYLGFYINDENYQEPSVVSDMGLRSFADYRINAFRFVEASVILKDKSSYKGSWHRVLMGWNLRWPGGEDPREILTNEKQLWVTLADYNNLKSGDCDYRVGFSPSPSPQWPIKNFSYPQIQPGFSAVEVAARSAMIPFDSAMTLSFGEIQARRLTNVSWKGRTSQAGHYYPFWRLNSCLDNIRLYFGAADQTFLHSAYYSHDGGAFFQNNPGIYNAMRYQVTNVNVDPAHLKTVEPLWQIQTEIPEGARFLSCSIHAYYPPNENTPALELKAWKLDKIFGSSISCFPLNMMPDNEQELFYENERVGKKQDLMMDVRYTARKTNKLDRKLETLGDPLDYFTNHVTEIPWIKEVRTRHIRPEGPVILFWKENQ